MKSAATLILIFIAFKTLSATYTTINDGSWNDNTNVWSLNGATPCGCNPGTTMDGDNVLIDHSITTTGNLKFKGGAIIHVTNLGSLGSNHNLTVEDATLTVDGSYEVVKVVQKTGSVVNINGVLITNGKYDLQAGVVNLINGILYMISGNLDIGAAATINMIGAKIDVLGGNLNNEGVLNIDANSCASSLGQWTNESTGSVNGSGSATSTSGNMTNLNIWDSNITWCSAGSDSGMTSAEDCATSNTTCGSMVLPVELVSFDVNLLSESEVHITWSTASEKDCDYYKIMTFEDGVWKELLSVDGSGDSEELLEYSVTQRMESKGVMYFRLVQVDFNGDAYYSEVKSIELFGSDFEVYPNPVNSSELITVSNITVGSSIVLYNSQGVVSRNVIVPMGNFVKISTKELKAGVYIIKVTTNTSSSTQRITIL